ncbi:MAG: hypothetical protein KDK08_29560, partial [Rhizobiaceae bacterium]|nr:hypothetical protein [Rhizobiaceae bacterium]
MGRRDGPVPVESRNLQVRRAGFQRGGKTPPLVVSRRESLVRVSKGGTRLSVTGPAGDDGWSGWVSGGAGTPLLNAMKRRTFHGAMRLNAERAPRAGRDATG